MEFTGYDWPALTAELDQKGYVVLPGAVTPEQCSYLASLYDNDGLYRKTVQMERFRFGRGQYRYFQYPLPPLVQELRQALYPRLVSLANQWMQRLQIHLHFPAALEQLLELCRLNGQLLPTPLILKYAAGGYNTLHQDVYGEMYFPLQGVVFLNQAGRDYTGGAFVLVEQTPRAQSRAIVLQPGQGDLLIFATRYRPQAGSRGYYRVTMKHGVSEVESGERLTLGCIFHEATS